MMASVQPLDLGRSRRWSSRSAARASGVLEIVNLNSPKQHVLSGDAAAVEAAVDAAGGRALRGADDHRAPGADALVAVRAGRRGPAASHLQRGPLPRAAAAATCRTSRGGGVRADADRRADFVDLLEEHVHTAWCCWRRSIDRVAERHPGAVFVEVDLARCCTYTCSTAGGRRAP